MAQPLTREALREELGQTKQEFREDLRKTRTGLREEFREDLRETTREIITHFNKGQAAQNERLDRIEGRTDGVEQSLQTVREDLTQVKGDVSKIKLAVVDILATDRHIHNLVSELKSKGIDVDERKVFAA